MRDGMYLNPNMLLWMFFFVGTMYMMFNFQSTGRFLWTHIEQPEGVTHQDFVDYAHVLTRDNQQMENEIEDLMNVREERVEKISNLEARNEFLEEAKQPVANPIQPLNSITLIIYMLLGYFLGWGFKQPKKEEEGEK